MPLRQEEWASFWQNMKGTSNLSMTIKNFLSFEDFIQLPVFLRKYLFITVSLCILNETNLVSRLTTWIPENATEKQNTQICTGEEESN